MENSGFVGGTLVHTDKGLVLIQDIKVSDKVLSSDDTCKEKSYQTVKNIVKIEQQKVIKIRFAFWIDEKLDIMEMLDRAEEVSDRYGEFPRTSLLMTDNQVFWLKNKG